MGPRMMGWKALGVDVGGRRWELRWDCDMEGIGGRDGGGWEGGGAMYGCTCSFPCLCDICDGVVIFISCTSRSVARAAARRLFRLRTQRKITLAMIARTTMGMMAAAA